MSRETAPESGSDRQGAAYRLFHTCFSSELPLPELPLCPRGSSFINVRLTEFDRFDSAGFVPSHDWCADDGRLICRSARRDKQYLLSFPGQASFLIDPDGVISCCPEPGVDQRRLRQLLLNQVLPRYLAHSGELVLHASAVSLPNGNTVAFLGESGRGKSTLASYCHAQGAQFIDDDCLLLRFDQGRPSVAGGVPTIRLYPDSLHALGYNRADFEPYLDASDKLQLCLPAGVEADLEEPRVLDRLFLLAPPSKLQSPSDDVCIEPAGGTEATMAIIGSAFSLAPSEPDTMARIFSQAGQLLTGGQGLRVNNLRYPREHAHLPEVLRALLEWERS